MMKQFTAVPNNPQASTIDLWVSVKVYLNPNVFDIKNTYFSTFG